MSNDVDIYVQFSNFVTNKKFELFKNTKETNRTLQRTIWSSHCYFAKCSLVERLVLTDKKHFCPFSICAKIMSCYLPKIYFPVIALTLRQQLLCAKHCFYL